MKQSGRALRLCIFVRGNDIWHHKPVYSEIVHRAHRAGLAGATVVRGIEGYGASSRIHTSRLFRVSEDVPVMITITDADDRIRQFLPHLDELLTSGLVVLDDVDIVHYEADDSARKMEHQCTAADHRQSRGRSTGSVQDRRPFAASPTTQPEM